MSKLYFRYGAMNCGKTTLLIQTAHNYEERGMHIILIKPKIDIKGNDKVISRIGPSRSVDFLIDSNDKIINLIDFNKDIAAIIVDEAQFLKKEQVDELYIITKQYDIPVLAYGLRNDFLMNTFEGSARLLALADSIEELKTICRCGVKATQNIRLKDGIPIFEGDKVLIDGSSDVVYEAVCGKCYLEKRRKIKVLK